jgi:hypothetical protein
LLWTGDSHAAQGNGEINLTALETAYREFNITVDVIKDKGKDMAYPRIETPTHWITMGYDNDLNKAWADARAETVKLIGERRNVNAERAAELMPQIAGLPREPGRQHQERRALPDAQGWKGHGHTGARAQRNVALPRHLRGRQDLNKSMDDRLEAMIGVLQQKQTVAARMPTAWRA